MSSFSFSCIIVAFLAKFEATLEPVLWVKLGIKSSISAKIAVRHQNLGEGVGLGTRGTELFGGLPKNGGRNSVRHGGKCSWMSSAFLNDDWQMTNWKPILRISFHINEIYKKLISKVYSRIKKQQPWAEVKISKFEVWLLECFSIYVKNGLSTFLRIQTFSQNTDQIQTKFRGFP